MFSSLIRSCTAGGINQTKSDLQPSLASAQEIFGGIHRRMSGINCPVQKERLLTGLLPVNKIKSFLQMIIKINLTESFSAI